MIDAYEIGIQLLLQEDVSAGLAVINRGLAEVDKAIAATSAELVGLVREAETATKAVAAAANGRSTPAASSDQKTTEAPGPVAETEAVNTTAPAQVLSSSEMTSAPENRGAEPVAPAAIPMSNPAQDNQPLPRPATREQAVSSGVPVQSDAPANVRRDQRAYEKPAEPEAPTPSVAPAQAAPAVAGSREFPSAPIGEAKVLGQEARRSGPPPSHRVSLTASVSRAQRPATAAPQPDRVQQQSSTDLAAPRERPAAPWSGVDHSGTQAEPTRLHERAAAPQSDGKSQTGSGGGTVMLDGRLVGQWLSEHMGREASRPPSGTSFFDPRQTPAWNVSGAL